MNNNEIELARKKYNCLLLEYERLEKARNRIVELQQDPKVKEYLRLVDLVNLACRTFESKDSMTYEAFHKTAQFTKCSNNILVYLGSYKQDDSSVFGSLIDVECADYICYCDLETIEHFQIEPSRRFEFEKDKKIVYMKNQNASSYKEYLESFLKFRCNFFEKMLISSQEEVVEELLQNNKQLVKGK